MKYFNIMNLQILQSSLRPLLIFMPPFQNFLCLPPLKKENTMYKYYYRFLFTIMVGLFSNHLTATFKAYEEDIEASKKTFLISGLDIKDHAEGALTLCIRHNQGTFAYDEAALVFEYLKPESAEVQVSMTRYYASDNCCMLGSSPMQVKNVPREETLMLAYRAKKKYLITSFCSSCPAIFKKHFTWVLPIERIWNALEETEKSTYGGKNTIGYVQSIMRKAGLSVDFGWWPLRATNLITLIEKKYVKPEYNRKFS